MRPCSLAVPAFCFLLTGLLQADPPSSLAEKAARSGLWERFYQAEGLAEQHGIIEEVRVRYENAIAASAHHRTPYYNARFADSDDPDRQPLVLESLAYAMLGIASDLDLPTDTRMRALAALRVDKRIRLDQSALVELMRAGAVQGTEEPAYLHAVARSIRQDLSVFGEHFRFAFRELRKEFSERPEHLANVYRVAAEQSAVMLQAKYLRGLEQDIEHPDPEVQISVLNTISALKLKLDDRHLQELVELVKGMETRSFSSTETKLRYKTAGLRAVIAIEVSIEPFFEMLLAQVVDSAACEFIRDALTAALQQRRFSLGQKARLFDVLKESSPWGAAQLKILGDIVEYDSLPRGDLFKERVLNKAIYSRVRRRWEGIIVASAVEPNGSVQARSLTKFLARSSLWQAQLGTVHLPREAVGLLVDEALHPSSFTTGAAASEALLAVHTYDFQPQVLRFLEESPEYARERIRVFLSHTNDYTELRYFTLLWEAVRDELSWRTDAYEISLIAQSPMESRYYWNAVVRRLIAEDDVWKELFISTAEAVPEGERARSVLYLIYDGLRPLIETHRGKRL